MGTGVDLTKYPRIDETVTDLELGKAAEHLVVADLILQGYRAYLTDQGLPYDVVLDFDGQLLRIQVKATREKRSVPQRSVSTLGYLFHIRRAGKGGRRRYTNREFDLIALVALDERIIAYMPFTDGVRQSLVLRPAGYRPARNATRRENMDQFPIKTALDRLNGHIKDPQDSFGF